MNLTIKTAVPSRCMIKRNELITLCSNVHNMFDAVFIVTHKNKKLFAIKQMKGDKKYLYLRNLADGGTVRFIKWKLRMPIVSIPIL